MKKRAGSIWIERATRGTLFVVVLLATALTLADETRLISLKHRQASEIIPLIQPLLGPQDAVSGTDYRLIVRTSDKNFRELEKLLAQLDTARRQLRITIKQTAARDTDTAGAGVSGEIKNDDVRVRLPRNPSSDNRGLVIKKDGLQIETQRSSTTTRNDSTQFVTTLDGARAFVRVGQSVAHVQRVLVLTGRQALIGQGVTFQDLVTGFDVLPRVQGNTIQLEITPRLSSLANPSTGVANFQEYSTTVVVKPGEWLDLGGIKGNGEQVRRAILESASTQTSEGSTVFIKVD